MPDGVWLAQCPEGRAKLLGQESWLFPGREVPTRVELVVVNEVVVGPLGPAPRGLIELAREDAHASGDGDVLGVEEAEFVVPVETTRRNPSVGQPVERDVVEDLVAGKLADRVALKGLCDFPVAV